jgi:ribose 5-phosphate isomerase B
MKIYLGADHRGYKLKEKIRQWLEDWNFSFEDLGAEDFNPKDDYTVYAQKVASLVGKEKSVKGILICGSGVGVDVAANKFDGVRAAIGKSAEQVRAGRRDDDMNILVLAADFTKDTEAKEMVQTFLKTEFEAIARHQRRLQEIKKIEANN